jgi:RNA polymerase sigma-70 factor (ECF subfamily)
VSESSYIGSGEPLKDTGRKEESVARDEDKFDALFEWMPNDFPITETVLPSEDSLEIVQEQIGDEAVVPRSRLFSAGEQKRSPTLARSFTDEFIDSKAGGPDSDEELFFRYQQGDEQAFFSIYQRYKGSVFAYCTKVMLSAGLQQDLVQDTYQEVFLRVSQYRNTFKHGEFRAWIFTITRNTCLSWKKRGLKHVVSSSGPFDADHINEEEALDAPTGIQRSDNPLEVLTKKEQTDLLLKAIAELPDTYREALMLCEYEGLTYEEIGRLTGTSLSTIRIRVFRAKKRLRKVLRPMLGGEYLEKLAKDEKESDDDE